MKIKVCGITILEQMQELQEIGVDYVGMIYYEQSKRNSRGKLETYQKEISHLDIKKVGVFVNATMDIVEKTILEYGLNAVQLHGDETDEYCLELMDKAEVIKVFRISDQSSIGDLIAPYKEVCHYYLFDTDTATYGGSGKQFNWILLEESTIDKPFFLSGGIGPEDLEKVKAFKHPFLYGVDVNSQFETAPGIKDMKLIKQFVHQIKNK